MKRVYLIVMIDKYYKLILNYPLNLYFYKISVKRCVTFLRNDVFHFKLYATERYNRELIVVKYKRL